MNPDIARLAHREIPGPIVVGRLRPGVAKSFGADTNWVWMSFDTLRKQLAHHREHPLDFYSDLDWLLLKGEALSDPRPNCFTVILPLGDGNRLFKATLKVVKANKRVMLLSLHKISRSDYKRIVRRAAK